MMKPVLGKVGIVDGLDVTALERTFDVHNAAVKTAIPTEGLLTLEVKDGWGPLCTFLGLLFPQIPSRAVTRVPISGSETPQKCDAGIRTETRHTTAEQRKGLDTVNASGPKVMTIVAAVGIAINGVSAWLFASGRKGDLNVRGAFAHMAADAVVSAGVVVAGLVILLTGWLWLDPVVSLAINAVIVWGTWGLLRDSVAMSMAAVPTHIDPAAVRQFIEGRKGVTSLHDLHVWPMSTTDIALTCHLVMPGGHPGDAFIHDLCKELAKHFKINHTTVQIEIELDRACALAPDEVV